MNRDIDAVVEEMRELVPEGPTKNPAAWKSWADAMRALFPKVRDCFEKAGFARNGADVILGEIDDDLEHLVKRNGGGRSQDNNQHFLRQGIGKISVVYGSYEIERDRARSKEPKPE